MKKVIITGANGFIAKNLARILKKADFFVIGTSRAPGHLDNYDEVYHGLLGEPLKDVYEKHNIDAIVHCAYDKDELEGTKSAEGTYLWAEQAHENNVGLQIFMSSISADEDALSDYGRKKYELERWFAEHGHVIFRLGLVVGNEGLFGRIISTVKKSPVIPLIDRGQTLVYLTDVDVIGEIVLDTILEKNKVERAKVWYLQQSSSFSFKEVLEEIKNQYGLFRIFIPVPYTILSIALSVVEKLKFLNLGIDTNNLKGMRQVKFKTFQSDLKFLGYEEVPLDALIKKTLN